MQAALAGCYDAGRAAALSGVPKSTVYYWARQRVVIPTVSPSRQKLWSYADLMALRIVYWLRHPKQGKVDKVPASPMPQVREALEELEQRNLDIWADTGPRPGSPLRVDRDGRVHLTDGWSAGVQGQMSLAGVLDLLAPFGEDKHRGPDLIRPRPDLRIIPGKVSGEPHLVDSRITTKSVAALYDRVRDLTAVAALYPGIAPETIGQAVDLEHALAA
jgi:DNA-binding transcriptional MerR regulator/uncharacterized protein (DUF433 family)